MPPALSYEFRFRGIEDAIEPPQHAEWQNDFAVFGLPIVATQEIGDGPDEG